MPTETVEFEGGWLVDYRATNRNTSYYRLDYRGKRIRSQGSPFRQDSAPFASVARLQDPAGDAEDITVRVERGGVSTKGTLFDVVGRRPLAFAAPWLARLRGSAQLAGDFEGRTVDAAVGIESPPFHPLRELNRRTPLNATNWIVLGIQGERRRRDMATTEVSENGVVLARAFVARGFLWDWSKRLTGVNKDLIRDVLALAGSYSEALALMPEIGERIRSETATPAEKLIYFIAEEGEGLPPEERNGGRRWERDVTVAATEGRGYTPPDQPRLRLWIEGYAWREIGRDRKADAWLNRVVAAIRWAPITRDADAIWLAVRYVNGYERVDPHTRREQLTVVLGVKL